MKRGILLINFGAPEMAKDAKAYLSNIFADPSLSENWAFKVAQPLLKKLIPCIRACRLEKKYKAIGGGSPLNKWTEHLRSALHKNIFGLGHDMRVYAGMRYFEPDFQSIAAQIAKDGIDDLLVIPLYPFYTKPVTASQLDYLKSFLSVNPKKVESFFNHPLFIKAWAERIRPHITPSTRLIFSAHSIPSSLRKKGDPYINQINTCAELICEMIGHDHHLVAYQSAPGRFGWMRPTTKEVLKNLSQRNVKDVCIVPISFISDHLETLYDLDQILIPEAQKNGILDCRRVPSLNDSPLLVDLFTRIALGSFGL
jgi:protoporphyrin/coproporphyrin ferrochelatase